MAGKPEVQDAAAAGTFAVVLTNAFIAHTHRDSRLFRGGRRVAIADHMYAVHTGTIAPGLIRICRFVPALVRALVEVMRAGGIDGRRLPLATRMALHRQIVQYSTPNASRGRGIAANQIFVQSRPQLGQLEAGMMANTFGVSFSIAFGGVARVANVILIALMAPATRRYRNAL